MQIPVVSNPKKRRRRLSAAQKRAGFGGRRAMGRKRGKRRNPGLATLAANPRRSRRRYSVSHRVRRYRRRNPDLFGFDVSTALYVAGGGIASRTVPSLIRRWIWPGLPVAGIMGYGVRLVGTVIAAYGAKMLLGRKAQQGFLVGGLAALFIDLWNEQLAPRIGLAGLGQDYLSAGELADAYALNNRLSGVVSVPRNGNRRPAGGRMAGYVDLPTPVMGG